MADKSQQDILKQTKESKLGDWFPQSEIMRPSGQVRRTIWN